MPIPSDTPMDRELRQMLGFDHKGVLPSTPLGPTPGAKIQRADMPLPLQGYENHPRAQALRDAYNSFGFEGNAGGGPEPFRYRFSGVRGPKDVQLVRSVQRVFSPERQSSLTPSSYAPGTYARYSGEGDQRNQNVYIVPPGTDRGTRFLAGHEFAHRWQDATRVNQSLDPQRQEVLSSVVGDAISKAGRALSKEEFSKLTTDTISQLQGMDGKQVSDLHWKLFKAYPEVEQMMKDQSSGSWR